MDILKKIDEAVKEFTALFGTSPTYLYLGDNDCEALDKASKMLVLKYADMEVIMVVRNNFCKVGV